MKICLPIIFLFLTPILSISNENSVYLHYGYNLYSTKGNLNQIGELVECDTYYADNGYSQQLTLGYRQYIFNNIYLIPNLSYSFQNYIYFNRIDNFTSRNDIDLQLVDLKTQSKVDITSNFLSPGINIALNIKDFKNLLPLRNDNLEFIFGFFYRMHLLKSFEQYEQIESPSNAGFINNNLKQRRNIANGEVNFLNNQMFYSGGIMYRKDFKNIKLNLGTNIAFTNEFLIKYNQINNTEITFFTGIEYKLKTTQKPIIKQIPPPNPKLPLPAKPNPESIVKQRIVKDSFNLTILNNIYKDLIIYEKEELLASTPIVNSIFYDSNQVDLSEFYIIDDKFNANYLDDIIKAHSVVIPRIIKILRENETSKVQLKAYHLQEIEDKKVIEQRLENLIKIFNRYGIKNDRLGKEIQIVNPKRIHRTNDKQIDNNSIVSENFRIDINLTGAPIQKYVKISKIKQLEGNINFQVDYSPDKNANLYISINDNIIKNIKKGQNEITIQKEINENEDLDFFAKLSGSKSEKTFYFEIDKKKLNKINVDLDYENFEAILRFDFNSADLTEENKQLLRQLYEILPSNIGIKILGSSDEIGDNTVNEKLEIDRANNTKEFLQSINTKNLKIETGRTNNKFPEETPQGRFLNRSIRIKLIIE